MRKSSSGKNRVVASIGIDLADVWSDWVSLDETGEGSSGEGYEPPR